MLIGYTHHMIREILEEPKVVQETITRESENARKIAEEINSEDFDIMYITGSGTSYHAGLASQYALSNLAQIVTSLIPASEFHRWIPQRISRKSLLMAISQSGESTDVLRAVRYGIDRGMKVLGITNTPGSTLARLSDYHLTPRSGKELAVPATKSYIAQLIAIFMLSLELARTNLNADEWEELRKTLNNTPNLLDEALRRLDEPIREVADKYADKNLFFILGSGPNYATALEGALKLKETCNVFAEGFATREFLHGPMRLVDDRTPIIMLTYKDEADESLSLIRGFKGFGAPIISIGEEHAELHILSDSFLQLPTGLPKVFSPILYVIPLQLLTYHISVRRGLNPDKPERLRKVVK
ncbi:hypothetical protein DRO55_06695 [Candidatus Bathyarchaeota archaeon]|nr:MAG: hypothetical protein DRO55_06695 [Candidatus Bathyarchaeota archaeon]